MTRSESAGRLVEVAPELARILKRSLIHTAPLYGVAEIRCQTVKVIMRDGIALATDLYLPPKLPAPAVLMRTPYGRDTDGLAGVFLNLARRGYVVVSQDCRGTGASELDHWDYYMYEPEDSYDFVEWVSAIEWSYTDQRLLHRSVGKLLIYHTAPFEKDTEISGFFRFTAWLSIDQPDTDFDVGVYEIGLDGGSILLSSESMRARYRESLRKPKLIRTTQPLLYDFERFMFVSREIKQGSRLRLVIGPINSIHSQRNNDSGGVVAEESIEAARPVNVRLFHDREHLSVLHVPIGRPCSPDEPTAPATSLVSASHRATGGTTYA